MSSQAALLAGREAIGLWPLMVWAYQREMVRATCGTDFRPAGFAGDHSSLAWAMAAAAAGAVDRGADRSSYATACCHDDALYVHGAVLKVIAAQGTCAEAQSLKRLTPDDAMSGAWLAAVPEEAVVFSPREAKLDEGLAVDGRRVARAGADDPRRIAFRLLVLHAEVGITPTWDPDVSMPKKCLPVLKPNGKPRCITGKVGRYKDKAQMCLVRYEGYTPAEAESLRSEARARYATWVRLLDEVLNMLAVDEAKLKRFKLNGIGAAREPWTDPALRVA